MYILYHTCVRQDDFTLSFAKVVKLKLKKKNKNIIIILFHLKYLKNNICPISGEGNSFTFYLFFF